MMLRTIQKQDATKELNIHYQLTMRAPQTTVFNALTCASIIDEWGGGPARVQPKLHGDVSLWDGEFCGSIREIEKPSLLVYTMRHQDWPSQYLDSLIKWRLEDIERGTLVQMHHNDLPDIKIKESQNEFWANSFLGPLKAYLEIYC